VKPIRALSLILCISIAHQSSAQELDRSTTISLFTGTINYQGDVNPNSFTFKHSNLATGLIIRKPLNRWFTVRAGVNMGKIEAADKWNRDYLKSRNLDFTTSIKEAYIGLEVSVLDMSVGRFTPYIYGGIAVFHFNPWTRDKNGVKTYLQPLSTEGQGLSQYPEQKPYKLTQLCLPFGGGAKFAVSDGLSIGIEFSQRKSFTDYIDDVSTHFVDGAVLLQEKGAKAVELSYRTDELPGGRPFFPLHGDQRGTPSEMDWYYFFGMTIEMKLNKVGGVFSLFPNSKGVASQRCPRNVNY
jgi:opacity protein-like surface antigen